MRGERVLVSAHGNSLRALVMVLEGYTPESILKREIGHRRADDLPARCGFDGEIETRSGGVTYAAAIPASQPSIARLRVRPQ